MINITFKNFMWSTVWKADIKSSLALKALSAVTDVKLQLCFDFFDLFPPPGPNCWAPVSLSQNRILHNVLCCKGCSSRRGFFFVWTRLICVSLVLSRETRRFIIMLLSFGPIKGFCFIFVCKWADKSFPYNKHVFSPNINDKSVEMTSTVFNSVEPEEPWGPRRPLDQF